MRYLPPGLFLKAAGQYVIVVNMYRPYALYQEQAGFNS